MKTAIELKYNWNSDIEPCIGTLEDVVGGFTAATRGVVTLPDGTKVFVKIATDSDTEKWIKKEILAYNKLLSVGYKHMPKLLSINDSQTAMAIEYLEGVSFENEWDKDKLDAVLRAQEALKKLTKEFIGDTNFKSGDVMDLSFSWSTLLDYDNLESVNHVLEKLGYDTQFTKSQIERYQKLHEGWSIKQNTLIHEDIRADNFGYDPLAKEGMLVDWNWLCVGDQSLDTTPLFISIYKSGLDPYQYHPEKYDEKMLLYLVGFWLTSLLQGDEDASERIWKLRAAQADSIRICLELLSKR